MAGLRKLTVRWDITTGKVKVSSCYLKREERIDVDLYVTEDGEAVALATNWGLNMTLKPQGLGDNDALVAITSWSASATTGLYTATAQAISSTALDTWLLVNDDTSDDVASKYGDLDLYYTISAAMKAKSDTLTVTVKPDVGRDGDDTPIAGAVSITASGYTMARGKILGRTTAGIGAIEELDPSAIISATFQRNMTADITLANGSCAVIADYLNANTFTLTLNGDSTITIL